MIDNLLKIIDNESKKLNNSDRRNLAESLNILIEIINTQGINEDKNIFFDVRNYLYKKLKTQTSKNLGDLININNLLNLRNQIVHGRRINFDPNKVILNTIWNILEISSYFDSPLSLANFLSYIFNYKYTKNLESASKKKIINFYKKIYNSLSESDQIDKFNDLAKRVLIFTTKEDLIKISNKNV